jgi:LPXTG-motif cell wall-anchored protein
VVLGLGLLGLAAIPMARAHAHRPALHPPMLSAAADDHSQPWSADPAFTTLGGVQPQPPPAPPHQPLHLIPAPQALTVGLPMLLVMGGIFYFRRRRQRGL